MADYRIYIGTSKCESLWKYSKSNQCSIAFLYRGAKSLPLSALRHAHMGYGGGSGLWLNRSDMEDDNRYPVIIFFDAGVDSEGLREHIRHKHSGQRYIFYYWNIVEKSRIRPDEAKSLGYEVWSFDPGDCVKYNLKHNPAFFFSSWYESLEKNTPDYDVCYVGRDKDNRADEIRSLFAEIEKQGISTNNYITAPKWYKRYAKRYYRKYMDFRDMIREECKGRAILEYVSPGQTGATLRTFDAIYNHRKLITNRRSIRDTELYNPQNVFILGEDDLTHIGEFIRNRCTLDTEFIDKYRFENWILSFG